MKLLRRAIQFSAAYSKMNNSRLEVYGKAVRFVLRESTVFAGHPEASATGHLCSGLLGFPLPSSKC
jgi:hypothetical protein